MTTLVQGSNRAETEGRRKPRIRNPYSAATLAVVTLTVYGFWWWWDLNRQLRRQGEAGRPWRALAAVTVGWVLIVPPFRSVRDTTRAIASAQRHVGLEPTVTDRTALRLAAIASAGLLLFGTSIWFAPGVLIFGWIPPVFGVAFIWYEQREFNRATEAS